MSDHPPSDLIPVNAGPPNDLVPIDTAAGAAGGAAGGVAAGVRPTVTYGHYLEGSPSSPEKDTSLAASDDPGKDYFQLAPIAIDKKTGRAEMAIPGMARGVVRSLDLLGQEAKGERRTGTADDPMGVSRQEAGAALEVASIGIGGAAGQTAKSLAREAPTVADIAKTALTKPVSAAETAALEELRGASPSLIRAEPRPAALEARKAGYVLPPQMASDKPGIVSNVLAGWSGKIKTQQAASAKNQQVTNALASKALGLPSDIPLTEKTFQTIRDGAGKAYEAVKTAIPSVAPDKAFAEAVDTLGGANSQAAQHFPGITKNQAIIDLRNELKVAKEFPTDAGIEVVKELRFNAKENLKAIGDPSKHALGLAQRQAADQVDDLIEREIARQTNADPAKRGLVRQYKAARQLIAKTYDVEGATNMATGDVSARGLGRLAARGRPLTGELETIANAANAFPKAMQNESSFGGNESYSALDFFGSMGAVAHGRPDVAGAILARPVARSVLLSKPYQNRMMSGGPRNQTLQQVISQANGQAPAAASSVLQQMGLPPSTP